jgi:hypothetical protein
LNIDDVLEDKTGDIGGSIQKERKIAINCIISTDFVKGAKLLLQDLSLLDSTFVRMVVKWCLAYYDAYGTAANTNIQGIYENERDKLSSLVSNEVSDFLGSLSQEFITLSNETKNIPFELATAKQYVAIQQVKRHQKRLDKYMLTNNVTKCEQEIANFNLVSAVETKAEELADDFSRYDPQENDPNYLFTPRGALGQLTGKIMRNHLTMVGGFSKSGKTRYMVDLVAQAFFHGYNIVVCNLEMTADDMKRLLDLAILKIFDKEGTAYIPVFKQTGPKKYTIEMTSREIKAHSKEDFIQHTRASRLFNPGAKIQILTYAQREMTVEGHLIPELDVLRSKGFTPDLICVDYGDLVLANPVDQRKDERLQVMTTRRELKKLAQTRNVHMLTATQTHSDLTVKQDKEKLSDSDHVVGIYQKPEEKDYGIYRVRCLVHRHLPFNPTTEVIILANNGIGQFHLNSKWAYQVEDIDLDLDDDFQLFVPKEDKYEYGEDIYDYI